MSFSKKSPTKQSAPQPSSVKPPSNTFLLGLAIVGVFLIGIGLIGLRWAARHAPSAPTATTPSPTPATQQYQTKSGKPPQFIVLAFDGSKSLEMWQQTREFAEKMTAQKKPLHFTYFISGVYFLTGATARTYHPPGLPIGTSSIGYSDSKADIAERIHQMNLTIKDGNEIGSHANGHFAGGVWSKVQWNQEFDEFNKLVFNWQENNGFTGEPQVEPLHLQPSDIHGFRAPLLSKNDGLYQVLKERNFWYDSSGVNNSPISWPVKNQYGTWLIPLANIPTAGTRNSTISMDYNFYILQSQTKDLAQRGTPLWQKYHDQMLSSYENYFNGNYDGERAPVIIGHHFSTWNDGVYWQVMQDFAEEECGKPEVHCVTFSELTKYLNQRGG